VRLRYAVLRRRARFVGDLRHLQESFAGHASGPGAIATDAGLLDQGYARAKLSREASGGKSTRSGADDG
jgi:hypothetical protein